MFVQKISTRVFCVNVKHSSFRPSRPFFGKCNLFVLIVNAIPGRNFLVLNFSPRSKFVEKVGTRAKNSNEEGGGGERWKGSWGLRASVSSSSLPLPTPF